METETRFENAGWNFPNVWEIPAGDNPLVLSAYIFNPHLDTSSARIRNRLRTPCNAVGDCKPRESCFSDPSVGPQQQCNKANLLRCIKRLEIIPTWVS